MLFHASTAQWWCPQALSFKGVFHDVCSKILEWCIRKSKIEVRGNSSTICTAFTRPCKTNIYFELVHKNVFREQLAPWKPLEKKISLYASKYSNSNDKDREGQL